MTAQTQLVSRKAPSEVAALMNDSNDLSDSRDIQATLLLAAIESFTVGLIIVTQDGTILHKNKYAQTLLEEMPCPGTTLMPYSLWRSCSSLMENRNEHSEIFPASYNIVLEDEIATERGAIHMRVQWFNWDNSICQTHECFLITLEDRQQSLTVSANQEAQRYGLTSRETEVWCLRRMEHSYKEIADTLHISENTVKKHLKNIYAKKEQATSSI